MAIIKTYKLNVVKNVDVKLVINMAKMRLFKFWNEAGDEKEKEADKFKKRQLCQFNQILKIK